MRADMTAAGGSVGFKKQDIVYGDKIFGITGGQGKLRALER